MTAMHRGLLHAVAWSLATGAAVTLSWWGVHTVMVGTAYDPPRALPLAVGDRSTKPLSSSTHRPGPARGAEPSPDRAPAPSKPPVPAEDRRDGKDRRTPPPEHTAPPDERREKPDRSSGAARSPSSGGVRGYTTDGGRVVFDLGASAATLVSASPSAGWSMRVWTTPTWVRVEFSSGAERVSVFCTWHDHAPRVDIDDH